MNSERSEIETDDSGHLRGRGIHDATVVGFHYILNARLLIWIEGLEVKNRLTLLETSHAGFRNVLNGMLLSGVYCWKLGRDDEKIFSEAWQVLFGGNVTEEDFLLTACRLSEKCSGDFLVYLESSYGGEIAVICKQVYLERDTNPN